MKLTQAQHEQFDKEGYLFFPGLFNPEETRVMVEEVPRLYSRREAFNVREKAKTRFAPILRRICTASLLQN